MDSYKKILIIGVSALLNLKTQTLFHKHIVQIEY